MEEEIYIDDWAYDLSYVESKFKLAQHLEIDSDNMTLDHELMLSELNQAMKHFSPKEIEKVLRDAIAQKQSKG